MDKPPFRQDIRDYFSDVLRGWNIPAAMHDRIIDQAHEATKHQAERTISTVRPFLMEIAGKAMQSEV